MRHLIWIGLFALFLAACGGGSPAGGEAGGEQATGAVVATADTELGTVLVDGDGLTLYIFTPDEAGDSTCYDDCADAWPPLLTDGDPQAEGDVDASLLGTTTREDGSVQVTYGGWPLYGFVQDAAPGDVNGQGIEGFGGTWWVIGPGGEPIQATAQAEQETVTTEDYGGGYDY